jgi:hypothetical protein
MQWFRKLQKYIPMFFSFVVRTLLSILLDRKNVEASSMSDTSGAMTFSTMTVSIMTLRKKVLNVTVTLSITDTHHNNALHYAERRISYCNAECHYAEFCCADCRGALLVM